MHWKSKKQKFRDGDLKIKKKFALFPKKLKDDYVVWLETYYCEYRYTVWRSLNPSWELHDSWSNETNSQKIENALLK